MRYKPPASAYVHIPFCRAKCGYCDFNSFAGIMNLALPYIDAVIRQIEESPPPLMRSIDGSLEPNVLNTVYFGGGTPSILEAVDLCRILTALRERFGLTEAAEVTLEANPESVNGDKLHTLREAGFNRISIGAQSFDEGMLRKLGRVHSLEMFLNAFADARRAGFDNVSIDLMFGLPGQNMQNVIDDIHRAVELEPDHISCYCLSIEDGTEFGRLAACGRLNIPDDDRQADMFLAVREKLMEAGFEHYEISNYSRSGKRCRHNETYWRNDGYWGYGAGAVSCVDTERIRWESDPALFISHVEAIGSPVASDRERLTDEALLGETIMLALRTGDGLDISGTNARFGQDTLEMYAEEIECYTAAGLLIVDNGRVRLTEAGMLLANEVLASFLR